jgi:hypothetical protein
MGFLGVTADITVFSLDSDILMIGLVFTSILQLMKMDVERHKIEKEDKHCIKKNT